VVSLAFDNGKVVPIPADIYDFTPLF